MKSYLLLFFVILTTPLFPQRDVLEVKSRIDSVLNNSFFDKTIASVDIYDLTQKESLYARNEKLLLRPASNMKILTTSAALLSLGPDYNFITTLCYTGYIKNSVLNGDLYVIGGCDPDFSVKDLDSLTAAIKSAGINKINGNLIGDVSMMDSLNWGKGWMWDDDCAFLTPLDINGNEVCAIVKPGEPGQKASVQIIPQTNYIELINNSFTVPGDSSDTYTFDKDWVNRRNIFTLKGNVSAKPVADSLIDTISVKVYNPQLYFLTLFRETLEKNGIPVSGNKLIANVPLYGQSIYNYKRKSGEVINKVNKESYNLGAEMTLRAMAEKYFGKPATAENGIKMIDSLIVFAGMNPDTYRIVDGSGISHYNLISSELLIEVLKYFYYQKPDLYKILYESFPVAGVDGTLKHRMKETPADNNVHAKTGTLSGVSSLSGYVTAANGHNIAFSIIMQNYTGSAKQAKDYEDKICSILAEFK